MDAKLLDRDWRFVTDSLYYLYGAETLRAFEDEVLSRFKIVIPANHYMFTVIHESDDAPTTYSDIVSIGEVPRYLDKFIGDGYDNDPYFQSWNSFRSTSVFRDTDMMPESYRLQTPLFREIYAKQGIHYAMRIYVIHNDHTIANISLFRSKAEGDFSDHDLELARTFAPHITQKLVWLLEAPAGLPTGGLTSSGIPEKFHLTPKEQEVVLLMMQGLDDAEVARELSISRATLKTHVYNIYRKVDVKNRVQLFAAMRGE